MLSRIVPARIDNTRRGLKPALWIFGLVIALKGLMAANSVFNGYSVASGADGIPLDTYSPEAAQAVVTLFGLWGVGHLVLCLLALLALVRYRAIVPLMFVVLLVEQLGRKLVTLAIPIERSGGAPGSFVSTGLLILMIVGLGLSLWPGKRAG